MSQMINENHPSYINFLKMEVKTMGVLGGLATLQSVAPAVALEANIKHDIYRNIKPKYINTTGLDFGCYFDLPIEDHKHKIILEMILKPGFSESSYVFSIGRYCDNGNCDLIRKYHFDYAPINTAKDRKSKYHLQFGGEQTPILEKLEISTENLNPYLSVPRIEASPMNLAILLDIVFCECFSVDTERLIESSQWRNLIKENESFLFGGYFSSIHSFFVGHHKNNNLYRDLRHGKSK